MEDTSLDAGRRGPDHLYMEASRPLLRLGVVAVLLGTVAAGVALLANSGHPAGNAATPAALGLATGLLGSLILWYRPGDRMGRLLTVTGVLFGLTLLAGGVLARGGTGSAMPAWLGQAALAWAWIASALSVQWILFILWFPDGRFTSRAWQRFFVIAATATLALAVTGYLMAKPGGRLPALFPIERAPVGLAGPLGGGPANALVNLTDIVSLLLPLIALFSLVQRYRSAGTLVRQQVKWLLAGTVATIVGSAAAVALQNAGGAAHPVGLALLAVANPLPVAAATVAVLRYRLWEIDLVVSKAVVYAVLWALVSIVIVVPALATGLLVGGSGALGAVGLALGVTAVFQPVRSRLERAAERIVYRDRPRGYALLSRFSQSLRASVDMGDLAPRLAETVRSGLGVAWAGVWIYVASDEAGSLRPAGTAGAAGGPSVLVSPATHAHLLSRGAAALAPQGPTELRTLGGEQPALLVPLVAGDELVGVLACGQRPGDPLGEVDLELLGIVGREAALALANLRLEAQLRQRLAQIEDQAEELRRSRQRLVSAQDDQRRRMERDLHDGAQQQLVALSAQLRRAAIARPADAHHFLDKVAGEAEEAVFALQELGRGIFPSVLADQGLPAALRTQAARVPMAIQVEVAPSLARRRFDAELEAALYFVGLEAMTNAQKHAPRGGGDHLFAPWPGRTVGRARSSRRRPRLPIGGRLPGDRYAEHAGPRVGGRRRAGHRYQARRRHLGPCPCPDPSHRGRAQAEADSLR